MASNPYANKVTVNNTTIIDLTNDTAIASDVASGKYFHLASGERVVGTASGGSMVIRDEQDSHGGTIRSITAGSVVTGTKTITANGTYDVAAFADASVNVPAPEPELQAKTATPSESQQTVTPDSGYDGLSSVTVGAISGTYVGSGITRRTSSDLTASGATVTVPSGYYSAQATKSVSSGTAGTPTATKGTVSNHSVSVTPSVTNATGYITGGTKTGTAVSVSASELVSGTMSVTENGTVDVTNYASVDVDVAGGVDMPVFTVVMAPDFSAAQSVTCNMTFAECMDYTNSGNETALVEVSVQGDSNTSTLLASKRSGSAAEITFVMVASGTPQADVSIMSDDTCSFVMQPSTVTTLTATANGTYTDSRGRLYSEVTVNVPSSGGSSYTLIYSTTMSVSTSSTSAVTLNSVETGDTSIWTSSQMVYVKVRDTAGPRNGYFYGTDCMFTINAPAMGLSATTNYLMFGQIYRANAAGVYSPVSINRTTLSASASGYGVYPTIVNSNGSIEMNARYDSSRTGTIDGTFSVEVYLLGWPNDESPLYGN